MTDRKRILWFSHLLPWPPKGGVQQRSFYLMKELAKHHDVTVAGFYQKAHQPDEASLQQALQEMGRHVDIAWFEPLPADRVNKKLLALKSLTGWPYTVRWAWDPAATERLRSLVQKLDPELVHFDTISLAPYVDAIGDRPATLTHHNIESDMLMRRAANEKNPAKRAYFMQEGVRLKKLESESSRKFQLHLVCSELDGERLTSIAPGIRAENIPNGVDVESFTPPDPFGPGSDSDFVFVGRLSWYPNQSAVEWFLTEIWPKILGRRPDAKVHIGGRDPSPLMIRLAAADPSIRVLGFVDEIEPLVHTAGVYVCPIFDGGGTKLKMLDAMALGKAIVAHPVACEGLDLTDGENVVVATNANHFAHCCLRLLSEPEERLRLGRAARQHAEERFSFSAIGNKLAAAYGELCREE